MSARLPNYQELQPDRSKRELKLLTQIPLAAPQRKGSAQP